MTLKRKCKKLVVIRYIYMMIIDFDKMDLKRCESCASRPKKFSATLPDIIFLLCFLVYNKLTLC